MNRRFLLLAVAALPLSTTAWAQADEGWQTVVGPDLRFRLEMPSPVAQSTAEKEQGNAAARVAYESKRANQMFDFDYVDYEPSWFAGRDGKEIARQLGRGEAEKAFPPMKFKYTLDEAVTLQGWDGYALDIEGEDGGIVMMRTYLVKNRLYRMLTTAQSDMRTRSAALRFINSLRIADTKS